MSDKIKKFLAYNGKVLVICSDTTELVEKARLTHEFSPTVTAAFGRMATITALMAADMKNEKDKLTIQIKGDGQIGTMLTVANNIPEIKGYVANPFVEVPLNEFGKIDVGEAVGHSGYINVIKDIGLNKPYIGVSTLTSGEIADDFANYFQNSEQKQTAVALGVLVDKNGVRASGGYIITPMPDAIDEDITKLERAIFESGAISKMLDQKLTLREIAKKVTGDEKIRELEDSKIPLYKCDCSKQHMQESLATIGKNDLEEIINEDGKAELVCHFCNTKYEFSKEELEEILRNI